MGEGTWCLSLLRGVTTEKGLPVTAHYYSLHGGRLIQLKGTQVESVQVHAAAFAVTRGGQVRRKLVPVER